MNSTITNLIIITISLYLVQQLNLVPEVQFL